MKKAYILVGASGVGKSTWVKNNQNKYNFEVVSKGAIRKSLGGGSLAKFYRNRDDLEREVNPIFDVQVNGIINKGSNICFDNMNASRKKRKYWYELFKRSGYDEVIIVWMHRPLSQAIELDSKREGYKSIGEGKVREFYKQITVPKIGVDCDSILFECSKFSEYEEEINEHINDSHYSPYHKETIKEHIDMTVQYSTDSILREIAKYHDLGKSVCRIEDNTNRPDKVYFRKLKGKYCMYSGHEYLSACYYMAVLSELEEITDDHWLVLECIHFHMLAHRGISKKLIDRYKITDREMDYLEKFAVIDNKARISDKELLDKLEGIREEWFNSKKEGD